MIEKLNVGSRCRGGATLMEEVRVGSQCLRDGRGQGKQDLADERCVGGSVCTCVGNVVCIH